MTLQRLAGLGAYGAAAGIALIFVLFVWQTLPGPNTGMDRTNALLSWISVGGVAIALIVVHVLIARVLARRAS